MSLPFERPGRGSHPFSAKYPGTCEDCQERFEVGEMVMYSDDALVHGDPEECTATGSIRTAVEPCGRCFLVHAGECF